nr:MAG TPA: hypothetical protein [Caudoviricetes sp.]
MIFISTLSFVSMSSIYISCDSTSTCRERKSTTKC